MIRRDIEERLKMMATKMPIISITGPRQSGKTTLAKKCFPSYSYVNLENPDTLADAQSDPRLFLSRHTNGLIIDEVQLFPELFSYIQTISDENNRVGEFILTGSQNFLLSPQISQSLAGRVFVTHLLPFSCSELRQFYPLENPSIQIYQGFYPRVYGNEIPPELFYPSYIQTYTERDVRQIINVTNLAIFQKFMRIVAGRVGQMLNYSSIAVEVGVEQKTIKSWISLLQASFVVFLLHPHYQNFTKRLTKTPKLYFYDTGLVCSLLGINRQQDVDIHWAKGALFENLVIADIIKNFYNRVEQAPLFYWRDNTGNEIDCIIDRGSELKAVEIKSSKTINPDFFKGLNYYKNLNAMIHPYLIYGGDMSFKRREAAIISWKDTQQLI